MSGKADQASAASGYSGPAVDLHHLNKATFGSRDLALEVLALFGRQSEKLLADVAAAKDAKSRVIAAHTLKGAALGVGALAVAAAAEELEQAAEDPIEMIGALARLSARVTEARLVLTQLLA